MGGLLHKKNTRSCPICHGRDWVHLRRYGVYSKCSSCGLVGLSVPVAESYESDYFLGDDGNPGHRDFSSAFEAQYDEARFVPELNAFDSSKGSLLDIGAALGSFMRIARRMGWEPVVGVEISHFGQDVIAGLGFDVVADLESLDPSMRFDLVTMHHTLEHLDDPVKTLCSIQGFLAEGGRILIEVPNWHSIQRRASGREWEDLRPDQHLWQYTPTTLVRLVEMAGLRVNAVTTLGDPIPSMHSFSLSLGIPLRLRRAVANVVRRLVRGRPETSAGKTPEPSFSELSPWIRPANNLANRYLSQRLLNKRLVVVCSA
jgi:SAM-dependent methyltransferase